MTLYEIIGIFKRIALTQPNIRTATDGSIYDVLNNNPSIQYDVFHIQQTTHQEDFETDYYGLTLFYDTRLDDDLESNRLLYQSTGKELLGNIIRTFCENFSIDFPTITYTPYTQRFVNLDCGVYCNIRLEVPKDIICADDYLAEVVPGSGIKLQDMGITITQNGLIVVTPGAEYDGIGEIRIETNVPQTAAVLQDKEVEYTENGSYTIHPDPAYDGLSSVSVDVDVPDNYEKGYDDGKEDGAAEQKAKMVATAFTENGEYTRVNGYSAVTVNVPQGQGYDEGYADGEAAQKARMISLSVTANGEYNREDGYSAITVNVPAGEDRYEEGYLDGMNYQKSLLVETAFTENGGYAREDGYSIVYVDVPQTGYTQEDLDEAYQRGFEDGISTCSGTPVVATSITINLANTITDSGTATTTVNPSSATTNLQYSSNDTSKATINATSGVITVKATGSVRFCVRDTITNLQSCKTVNVVKTNPNCKPLTLVYLTTASNERVIFYDLANLPSSTNIERVHSNNTKTWVNNLCSMEIDGTVRTATSAFTFSTPGKHYVIYNSPVGTVPDYLFSLAKNPHPTSSAQNEKIVEAHIGEGYGVLLNNAFDGDTNLTAVTLPSTMKVLGKCPFQKTGIKSIVIPNSVTANTEITDYRPYVGRYVMNSEDQCWFSGCTSLTSVTIGNGITKIPGYAFDECAFRSVSIPSGVTIIDGGAFEENLHLTSVTIPNTVRRISSSAFKTTCLNNVTIPNSVQTIAGYAFANIWEMTAITFGTGITSIAANAFYRTTPRTMTFNGTTPPTLGNTAALSSPNVIYVPSNAVNAYKAAWPSYANKIQAKP